MFKLCYRRRLLLASGYLGQEGEAGQAGHPSPHLAVEKHIPRCQELFNLRRLWSCKANAASGFLWGICAETLPCSCRALEGSSTRTTSTSMMQTKPNQTRPNPTQSSGAGRDMGQVHGAEWPPPLPVGPTPWLCCSNPLWAMVPEPSHPSALSSPVDGTMGACWGGGGVAFPSVALSVGLGIGHSSCLLGFFPPSAIGASSPDPQCLGALSSA